ncbi:MAG: acyl-ACP--UDP-N-acetylglucosamine O-acyltransferase [Alphaproteobacteria bacterium]|nr:acyl-ACP--UDP-N-acetylglucosamine O-acyltransferase [Alphaproteobacteria bacterium]
MSSSIHPTAIIEDGASIGDNVAIGPYSYIGANVTIGAGCTLHSHVVVDGHTTLGEGNEIFPFAVIGKAPQHMLYEGEASTLVIGNNNLFRENTTIHPGTKVGAMTTIIGDGNMFFVGCHVAHDCVIGNNVIMTNDVLIGGHVVVDDYAYLGGSCAIKQYIRIGPHAMISGLAGVTADVIPFGNVFGNRAELVGLNLIGLKRRGFSKDSITTIRRAYRMLFAMEGTFNERLEEVERLYSDNELVAQILQFIKDGGDNPLCHPAKTG